MDNIFGIYKPKGITSNDAVQKVKRLIGVKGIKVGHAGTLDPLAQGVLVIAVGREATKKISEVVKKEKEYIAEITFGFESSTDDAEGDKILRQAQDKPNVEKIKKILPENKSKSRNKVRQIKETPELNMVFKVIWPRPPRLQPQPSVLAWRSKLPNRPRSPLLSPPRMLLTFSLE